MQKFKKPIVDDKYFKSDDIIHGRVVRKFLEALIENVFKKSHLFWQEYSDLTGATEFPLLNDERNLYSIFSAAIDEITPVHMSELSFNKADTSVDSRRVDFWCLSKNGENGKAINYFIELKKIGYCLSKGTKEKFTSSAEESVIEITDQIRDIKRIHPNWLGDDGVYIGIIVVHSYLSAKKEPDYDENQIRENIHQLLDKRLKAQLLFSTWTIPDYMEVQWHTDKCMFVSIAGIAITKSK